MTQNNAVGWFEIPVTDMKRAKKFYEDVFGFPLEDHDMDGFLMAWFPWDPDGYGAGGALVKHEMYTPSKDGTIVYLTAKSGDLANELGKVETAGGKVLIEKKPIGEHGFIGVFLDTEGNRVAMHSMK